MATALNVVTGALQLLEIRVAESAVTSSEAEDGLTALNDMMNEWNVDGINIGYETLDDSDDELSVKLGSLGAIKANLAVYIAPEYGRVVTEALQKRADRSKKSLRASIPINRSEFPDTLPIGSGNENGHFTSDGDVASNLRSSKFYQQNNRSRCN